MDFKGHSPLENGVSCHPLTMLDDHSRFSLACGSRLEQGSTVQGHLRETFRRYGLPDAMFVRQWRPLGLHPSRPLDGTDGLAFSLQCSSVIHSRPYYLVKQREKNERFHRSLKAEVFAFRRYRDLADAQCAFDQWRSVYNLDRPHEALNYDVSGKPLSPEFASNAGRIDRRTVDYDEHEIIRSVSSTKADSASKADCGRSAGFSRERLAIRPLLMPTVVGNFFAAHQIAGDPFR